MRPTVASRLAGWAISAGPAAGGLRTSIERLAGLALQPSSRCRAGRGRDADGRRCSRTVARGISVTARENSSQPEPPSFDNNTTWTGRSIRQPVGVDRSVASAVRARSRRRSRRGRSAPRRVRARSQGGEYPMTRSARHRGPLTPRWVRGLLTGAFMAVVTTSYTGCGLSITSSATSRRCTRRAGRSPGRSSPRSSSGSKRT